MKDNKETIKAIYEKYDYYKDKKDNSFFHPNTKRKLNIPKMAATFILGIGLTLGVTYAGLSIYKDINRVMTPAYTNNINESKVWVGTFQLVWNELMDQVVKGNIEFEQDTPDLVRELNRRSFSKDSLDESSYYIKVGKTNEELKNNILKDIKNKFDTNNSEVLDSINFNPITESYTLYAMLSKPFNFLTPFDRLGDERFKESAECVKYFGINNASKEELNKNINVLFYNNIKNDFAVSLNTKEGEEVILYRTDTTGSFEDLYNELQQKTRDYKGNKTFNKVDEIKVPYISIDTIVNYNELCNKEIKGTKGYISNAIQNVKFNLNEKGGELVSEAAIKGMYMSIAEEPPKYFFFKDDFVLFLKEKDKEQPYFALLIDNTDFLVAGN